jgi:hypothetical protein
MTKGKGDGIHTRTSIVDFGKQLFELAFIVVDSSTILWPYAEYHMSHLVSAMRHKHEAVP